MPSQIADATNWLSDVRFGSLADMCSAKWHVRFTPKSGHQAAQTKRQLRPKRTLGLLTITGLADNRSLTAPVDEYRSLAKKAALDGPRPHI